ncbi:MAG: energy transducer TonB [Hyphomonadaceae bacterium]|nr:energy transducer TonB [Hyphomonadaceae bacterium]
MLVRATRAASLMTLRALFYLALFVVVVTLHLGLTTALSAIGLASGIAMFVSGSAILGLVLFLLNMSGRFSEWIESHRELQRLRQRLPSGSCCVIWRADDPLARSEETMPWEFAVPPPTRYPEFARKLGIEGVAVLEFEVNAEGKAKNIGCVDVWPSNVFYEAARDALAQATFTPRRDEHMRFGATYRVPFVFRIEGAARPVERESSALASLPRPPESRPEPAFADAAR